MIYVNIMLILILISHNSFFLYIFELKQYFTLGLVWVFGDETPDKD